LEKFRADRPRIISEITKQFEDALRAKTLGEKMNPKWGNPEYVDRIMGMFYEKMNPEMKKASKYWEQPSTETNKKPDHF
jgi:hypothetical protein